MKLINLVDLVGKWRAEAATDPSTFSAKMLRKCADDLEIALKKESIEGKTQPRKRIAIMQNGLELRGPSDEAYALLRSIVKLNEKLIDSMLPLMPIHVYSPQALPPEARQEIRLELEKIFGDLCHGRTPPETDSAQEGPGQPGQA